MHDDRIFVSAMETVEINYSAATVAVATGARKDLCPMESDTPIPGQRTAYGRHHTSTIVVDRPSKRTRRRGRTSVSRDDGTTLGRGAPVVGDVDYRREDPESVDADTWNGGWSLINDFRAG
jgi:hypothetical protein